MGAKRKSYTPKFRADAARLVIETGRSIAEVAREIGVGESLLGRWVAVERAKMEDPPEALDVDERAKLTRLRREVAELRMDRAFLKMQQPSLRPRTRTGTKVRGDRRGEGEPQHHPDDRAARGVPIGLLPVGGPQRRPTGAACGSRRGVDGEDLRVPRGF